MKGVMYSVTKLSLLLLVLWLLVFTFTGVVKGSEFVSIVNIVIAFYYWNKIGTQDSLISNKKEWEALNT